MTPRSTTPRPKMTADTAKLVRERGLRPLWPVECTTAELAAVLSRMSELWLELDRLDNELERLARTPE